MSSLKSCCLNHGGPPRVNQAKYSNTTQSSVLVQIPYLNRKLIAIIDDFLNNAVVSIGNIKVRYKLTSLN